MNSFDTKLNDLTKNCNSIYLNYCEKHYKLYSAFSEKYDVDYKSVIRQKIYELSNFVKKFADNLSDVLIKNFNKNSILDYATINDFSCNNLFVELSQVSKRLESLITNINASSISMQEQYYSDFANAYLHFMWIENNWEYYFDNQFNEKLFKENLALDCSKKIEKVANDTINNFNSDIRNVLEQNAEIRKEIESFKQSSESEKLYNGINHGSFADRICVGFSNKKVQVPKVKTISNIEDAESVLTNLNYPETVDFPYCNYIDFKALQDMRSCIAIQLESEFILKSEKFNTFAKNIVLQLLNKMPIGKVKVSYVDEIKNSELNEFIASLGERFGNQMFAKCEDGTNVGEMVADVNQVVDSRLNLFDGVDFFEYNKIYADNNQPIQLFILNAYSQYLDVETLQNLFNIISNGSRVGVFTILIGKELDFNLFDVREEVYDIMAKINEQISNTIYCDSALKFKFDKVEMQENIVSTGFVAGEFLDSYANLLNTQNGFDNEEFDVVEDNENEEDFITFADDEDLIIEDEDFEEESFEIQDVNEVIEDKNADLVEEKDIEENLVEEKANNQEVKENNAISSKQVIEEVDSALIFEKYEHIRESQVDAKFRVCLGLNFKDNEKQIVEFDENSSERIVLIGDIQNSKLVQSIMISSFIKQMGLNKRLVKLAYFDASIDNGNIKDYVKPFSKLIEYAESDEAVAKLDDYKVEFENLRSGNLKAINSKIIFINSCEKLAKSSGNTFADMIINGYKYSRFVIPHFASFNDAKMYLGNNASKCTFIMLDDINKAVIMNKSTVNKFKVYRKK